MTRRAPLEPPSGALDLVRSSSRGLVLALALLVAQGGVALAATPPPDASALAEASAAIDAWLAAPCVDDCKRTAGTKLDSGLLELLESSPATAPRKSDGDASAAKSATPTSRGIQRVSPSLDAEERVLIVAHRAEGHTLEALEKALVALDFEVESRAATTLGGRLPVASLGKLGGVKSLGHAAAAWSEVDAGIAETQGDVVQGTEELRALTGLTGAFVKVGVISDSYDCLGGAAADVASGDLPAGVVVLREASDCAISTDEGRAMLQIIHDVAPDAELYFHTADGNSTTFIQGVRSLAEAGVSIIVEDLSFPGEPVYQDGLISLAIEEIVEEHGVSIISSAGNTGRQRSWEGPFTPGGLMTGRGEVLIYEPSTSNLNLVFLPAGRRTTLALHWDQPYRSVSGGQGATSDLDIFLFNFEGQFQAAARSNNIETGEPLEVLTIENNSEVGSFILVLVTLADGPQPNLVRLTTTRANFGLTNAYTFSDSIIGQKSSPHVISVGAADYRSFPEFLPEGETFDGIEIESFSSVGGTPILFDRDGNRIFEVREKPEIVGPNRGNTTFFGRDLDDDEDTFPNFAGTSASAPHVGGLAALLVEAAGGVKPNVDQLRVLLSNTAIDMDDPFTAGFDTGFDFGTGYGFVDALAAADVIAAGDSPPTVELPTGVVAQVGVPITLEANVIDDGLPLWGLRYIEWVGISWPPIEFLTPRDREAVTVRFQAPGTYRFRVYVSDGATFLRRNVYVQVTNG